MGRTITFRNAEFDFRSLARFFPAMAILVFWGYIASNLELDAYSHFSMNLICTALFTVLSSYALDDGHKTIGILSFVIGLGVYYGTIVLTLTLPPSVLLQQYVAVTLVILNTTGASISLFGAAALGLWLSSSYLDSRRVEVKYGALVLAAGTIFVWIFGLSFTFFDVVLTTLSVPGVELLYTTVLIMASSLFIPRRQIITVFLFTFGLFLAIWGVMTLSVAIILDTFLVGYYLRIIGTIIFTLFALPLGARSIYSKEHPENPLYIVVTVWFLIEVILIQRLYIFSPVRVFGIFVIIYFSMKTLKIKRPLLTGIGTILSFIIAIGGVTFFVLGFLLSGTLLFGGLALAVVGTSLLLFFALSFGESLRNRFIEKRGLVSGIGLLLVFAGLAFGIAGLMTFPLSPIVLDLGPLLFIHTDIFFIALVGFGSSLIYIRPRRSLLILTITGYGSVVTLLNNDYTTFVEYFVNIELFYYPLLLIMIFFTVQQYRIDPKKLGRPLRKKKTVPLEITPETLISAGMHKVTVETPAEPVETIEPIQSSDFEPDQPIEDAAPVEPVEQTRPSEPVEPTEGTEQVESVKSIETNQQRISVDDGESLPDGQRMARNWYNRAFGFLEVGDLWGALKAIETALKWQPDHPQALALKEELLEK